MADMIPLNYALIGGAIALGAIGLLFALYMGARNNSPEGKIYADARAKQLPVLDVVDISTGHGKVFLGTKDEDGDPMFEIEGLPMKIDPSMCSGDATPERYGNGLNIWHFASPKALPLSVDAMLAFKTMKNHRLDKPAFLFVKGITDQELFSLIRLSKAHLKEAAMIFVAKYHLKPIPCDNEDGVDDDGQKYADADDQKTMDAEEFVEIIEAMKSYFAVLPVETGFYCKETAFALTPYAHSSQDIERIKYLIEQKIAEQYAGKMQMMQYVIMFVMVVGIIIGLVAVLLVLGGGSK
jgi:hypothetical protein